MRMDVVRDRITGGKINSRASNNCEDVRVVRACLLVHYWVLIRDGRFRTTDAGVNNDVFDALPF